MFKFHPERLDEDNELGSGAFGEVYPYQKDPQDTRWAVKKILAKNIDDLLNCLPEIVLGFACDHPCVVPVKGYFVEKVPNSKYFHVYLKVPRMKETLKENLKTRQRKKLPFTEEEIIKHFYSLTCGLEYLHSKKIYHGDIKPDNLLLDEQGNLKITDVGIAKHVEEEDASKTITKREGTYFYTAPEIFHGQPKKGQLLKADLWSLGVVILELFLLDLHVLNSLKPRDEIQNRVNELLRNLKGKFKEESLLLVKRLLNLDPAERPDIGDIKAELETNFAEYLEKKLLNIQNLVPLHKGHNIKLEKQPLEGNSEKYEAEINHLREEISQLKLELIEQKSQHEAQIRVMVGQRDSRAREVESKQEIENRGLQKKIQELEQALQKQLETNANSNERLRVFEKQIRVLEQKKETHEERNKDLEKRLEASEALIKALQESHLKEKAEFQKALDALQLEGKELEILKTQANKESFGEDYEANLKEVCSQLTMKWGVMEFKAVVRKLKIDPRVGNITDEMVDVLSWDIIEALGKNNLLNLFGLELDFNYCKQLTDKALEHLSHTISRQSLHLQHLSLNFMDNQNITDTGVESLSTVIEKACKNLKELRLNYYNCKKVTREKKDSLKKRFAKKLSELEIY